MGLFDRAFARVGDVAQQVTTDYKRSRQPHQQQPPQPVYPQQSQQAALSTEYTKPHQPHLQPQPWQQSTLNHAHQDQQADYQAHLTQAKREAARLQGEYEDRVALANMEAQRLKREQSEAERQAQEQIGRDRAEAERLTGLYQRQYEEEMRIVESQMCDLNVAQQTRRANDGLSVSPPSIPRGSDNSFNARPAHDWDTGLIYPPLAPRQPSWSAQTNPMPASPPNLAQMLHLPSPALAPVPAPGPTTTQLIHLPPPSFENAAQYEPASMQVHNAPTHTSMGLFAAQDGPPSMLTAMPSSHPHVAHQQEQPSATYPTSSNSETRIPAEGNIASASPSQERPPPAARTCSLEIPALWSETPKLHPCGVIPITECIESLVSFHTDWFMHPTCPNFTICSRCYVDYIYDTPFRDEFRLSRPQDGSMRMCLFSSIRVKERLWPSALASRNLSHLIDFMKDRQGMDPCPEKVGQEGWKWYVSDELPGATICRACHEDTILAGPFSSHFKLQDEPPSGIWACDLSSLYIKRMHRQHSATNNWPAFTTEANKRSQLPECGRLDAVLTNSRAWFASARAEGLQICQACLLDFFGGTPDASFFEQTFPRLTLLQSHCRMGQVNILTSAHRAATQNDYAVFWNAVNAVSLTVYCDPTGTKNTPWFTLPNDPDQFGVCGSCMEGIVRPLGATRHFMPKPGTSKEDALVCSFSVACPRFALFMEKLSEVLFTGKWEPLGTAAKRFAAVPICPRISMTEGLRWWGWKNLHICHDCYLVFAQGTRLEPEYEMDGQLVTEPRICDMFSQRMRRLYAEACEAPSPSTSLNELLRFAHQRRLIYLATVPQCERILIQQRFAAQQAQMLGVMGSTYKLMGGMVDATQGHAYTVGNAALGYGHANDMVLTGVGFDAQAAAMLESVSAGGPKMRIAILEAQWKEVE